MSRPVTFTRCPPRAAGDVLRAGRWPGLDAPAQELTPDRVRGLHLNASTGTRRPPLRPDMAHLEDHDGS